MVPLKAFTVIPNYGPGITGKESPLRDHGDHVHPLLDYRVFHFTVKVSSFNTFPDCVEMLTVHSPDAVIVL